MKKLIGVGAAWLCAGLASGMAACSGDDNVAGTVGDASPDQAASSDDSSITIDTGLSGPLDAQAHNCNLGALNGGADPVLLCSEETALLYLLQYGYQQGVGVGAGFSSQSPYAAVPQPDAPSALADNLGLVASLGAFHCNAQYYGDNIYAATLDGALADLVPVVSAALVAPPAGYDGELYFRMRNAALASYAIMNTGAAAAINAAADAYARNILASYVHMVAAPPAPPPLPVDGGTEAGAGEAGPGDAGASDAMAFGETGTVTEAGAPVDAGGAAVAVIGDLNAQNGSVSYAPRQVAMAAAALLEMASREASKADAGVEVAALEAAANSALAYLWVRGRDPVTGMFYQALVTSQDPAHDALSADATQFKYASDALLTDVQSSIVLALARAMAPAMGFAGDAGATAYGPELEALVSSMTNAGLFNGQTTVPPMMDPTTYVPPPGAWAEGLVPSLHRTLTNQTTLSSALMLGGYVRARALGVPTSWSWEVSVIRQGLSFTTPTGGQWNANTNMASVVTDHLGDVVQLSYLAATSRGWGWAQAFSPTGGDAGVDPTAMSYSTAAVNSMIEGLSQYWYEQVGMSPCAY